MIIPLNTDGTDQGYALPVHAYLVQGGFGSSTSSVSMAARSAAASPASQAGPAPIARGKILNRHSAIFQVWEAHLEENRKTYVEYTAKFGTLPWLDDTPIEEFQDSEVPPWATE